MAIGKESLNRAASVAGVKKVTSTAAKSINNNDLEKKATEKKASARKTTAKKAAVKKVELSPVKELMDEIVYQESSQVLNRDAEMNETFGIGDSIPIYYL